MARYNQILEIESDLAGEGLRIGMAMSRFNEEIGDGLLAACVAELAKHGVRDEDVLLVTVPGALELPLALREMALTEDFHALIALGAVIRGQTPHFDYVAGEAARGVMEVMLSKKIPIAFGVLTTNTERQARDRAGGRRGNKGEEAARTVIEMVYMMKGRK